MGCGSSSLTGDSYDSISATSRPNRARKIDVYENAPPIEHHNVGLTNSRPTMSSSSDPTKGSYLSKQAVEPLRDVAPPSTEAASNRHRILGYHGKGAYNDLSQVTSNDAHHRQKSYHGKEAYNDVERPAAEDGRHRKKSYHDKGAYHDLTMDEDNFTHR